MAAIRKGTPDNRPEPQPAAALRIMYKFAHRRGIGDLLDSMIHFERLDAMSILQTAAFSRPAEEAAELAIGQWRRESSASLARAPLTAGIVHDVASQRTVLDVAVFVRKCGQFPAAAPALAPNPGSNSKAESTELAELAELAEKTLQEFVTTRTNLDKARLYMLLRDDECHAEAAHLLKQTLQLAYAAVSDGPDELHDLVGALRHLSPSEQILEDWIKEAMENTSNRGDTVKLVANLLAGAPRGTESLAGYVGRTWHHRDLTNVCGLLSEQAPEVGEAVRRHLAARQDFVFLAEIMITWYQSAVLTKSTKDLIAAIVARYENRAAGPRPKADIDKILRNLEAYNAPADCIRMLRTAAASHIEGRTGVEIAELLTCIENRRQRRLAARLIGEGLAEKILRDRIPDDQALFVEYLKALRERDDADSVYWALRELPDPAEGDLARAGAATVIGNIARLLYAAGLDGDAFNLLERCLENEQWVTPKDVGEVVASLRKNSQMPQESRLDLLSATVGRWAELRRRSQAVVELRKRDCNDEAEAVIHSLH
jgi:hypothetical protein